MIENNYDSVSSFSEGLSRVRKGDEIFFIDSKGMVVLKPYLEVLGLFSDGLLMVSLTKKKIYKHKEGQKPTYSYQYTIGYIDKKGRTVIFPQFRRAEDFSERLAAVWIDGKYGFINKTGEIVIKPIYAKVGEPSEGIIAVNTDGEFEKWGYINTKGEWIWKPTK